jgi:hypothetical protein
MVSLHAQDIPFLTFNNPPGMLSSSVQPTLPSKTVPSDWSCNLKSNIPTNLQGSNLSARCSIQTSTERASYYSISLERPQYFLPCERGGLESLQGQSTRVHKASEGDGGEKLGGLIYIIYLPCTPSVLEGRLFYESWYLGASL